jgi:nitrate/nitrite transport system substrate-binding protein
MGMAEQVNQIKLYREAAATLGIAVPDSPLRASTLMDGRLWDGSDPEAYATGFNLDALRNVPQECSGGTELVHG